MIFNNYIHEDDIDNAISSVKKGNDFSMDALDRGSSSSDSEAKLDGSNIDMGDEEAPEDDGDTTEDDTSEEEDNTDEDTEEDNTEEDEESSDEDNTDLDMGDEAPPEEDGSEESSDEDNTGDPGASNEPAPSELAEKEKEVFADLSPAQMAIKNNELITKFNNVYSAAADIAVRLNTVIKSEQTTKTIEFLIAKVSDMKDTVAFYISNTYATKSYIENYIYYQNCMVILNDISKVISEISEKTE